MQLGGTRNDLIKFHSRYKLVLMAHSVQSYRYLGQLVASIADYDLAEFYLIYRLCFMQALVNMASKKRHTNVLMHIQGYFKKKLSKAQKAELSELIIAYHDGLMPLLAPLTLIKHYLLQYPDPYLSQQTYFNPYPEALRLRYGL